jgi:hypothetical protein
MRQAACVGVKDEHVKRANQCQRQDGRSSRSRACAENPYPGQRLVRRSLDGGHRGYNAGPDQPLQVSLIVTFVATELLRDSFLHPPHHAGHHAAG